MKRLSGFEKQEKDYILEQCHGQKKQKATNESLLATVDKEDIYCIYYYIRYQISSRMERKHSPWSISIQCNSPLTKVILYPSNMTVTERESLSLFVSSKVKERL